MKQRTMIDLLASPIMIEYDYSHGLEHLNLAVPRAESGFFVDIDLSVGEWSVRKAGRQPRFWCSNSPSPPLEHGG